MSQKPRDRKAPDREAKRSFSSRKFDLLERAMLDKELSGNEFRFLAFILKHANQHTLVAIVGDDGVRDALDGFKSAVSCWRAREKLGSRGYFTLTPGSGRKGTRYDFTASMPAETLPDEKGYEPKTSEYPSRAETPALARQQAVHLQSTPSKDSSDEDSDTWESHRATSLQNRTCYLCGRKATHQDLHPDEPEERYLCAQHAANVYGNRIEPVSPSVSADASEPPHLSDE